MGERISVLDHGYVEPVEFWGSDERVIEAARMSTGGGFVSWEPYEGHPKGDAGLLRYLWTHKHSSPFEFAGMTIEVQAPIMVFREWMRHRTQSYNEASARYSPLPDINYLPTVERCLGTGANTKQAAAVVGVETLTFDAVSLWLDSLEMHYRRAEGIYQSGLRRGVPKELARLCLPVGRYSRMRASANLRNWCMFLTLRLAPEAQWEIQKYAQVVAERLRQRFPRTMALFDEGVPTL